MAIGGTKDVQVAKNFQPSVPGIGSLVSLLLKRLADFIFP
jgi:hypothetical protein